MKFLIVIVKTLEHLGHVADCVGVKSNTNNDAAYRYNPFNTIVGRNISEADSCESLKAPIEWNEIVKLNWILLNSSQDNPAVFRKSGNTGNTIPKTSNQMVDEEYHSHDLEKLNHNAR